jgi:hypothetical protein
VAADLLAATRSLRSSLYFKAVEKAAHRDFLTDHLRCACPWWQAHTV